MKGWKVAAVLAAAVIVLAVPFYLIKTEILSTSEEVVQDPAVFVGGRSCVPCHKKEYDLWLNSHHDLAMDLANDQTVLGDFDDAVLEHDGVISRFYRRDDKFFVRTPGPGGEMGEFEITHTFGVTPLQQYLIPFPGGRLQCLPIAWDSEKNRWFHLVPLVYPEEKIPPEDWLYWTNAGQNWNGMCAECHSTRLRKGYDPETDTFDTTWSEIDVNCEACHGPGSRHVAWAELPEMARPQTENYDLVTRTSDLTAGEYIQICARCHARRSQMGDFEHPATDLLDIAIPTLLDEGVYFADGQILGEVYVYASLIQSKMYRNDVSCRDCHDAHSLSLLKPDKPNDVCLQCHRRDIYDRYDHHFHKKPGEAGEPLRLPGELVAVGRGSECIECHMAGRYYMGNDFRHDHSFRVPRPDLSLKLKTPNACTNCHRDRTDRWANEQFTKWYGIGRRPHYGTILDAGRGQKPDAIPDLERLIQDELYPVNVRATALSLLSAYPGYANVGLFQRALGDPESLIRHTAARYYTRYTVQEGLDLIGPLLYDPMKAVRAQAAMNLSVIPSRRFKDPVRGAFEGALAEYESFMRYASDFVFGRFNLGNLYSNLGQTERAVEQYLGAIRIDNLAFQAKNNLAILYSRMGRNEEALLLLREVERDNPGLAEVAYSLGLLLAEKKEYPEAVLYLEKAAAAMPRHARIHYNLGLLQQQLSNRAGAGAALKKALEIQPDNPDFLYALADFHIRAGEYSQAKRYADQLVANHPHHPQGRRILDFIKGRLNSNLP